MSRSVQQTIVARVLPVVLPGMLAALPLPTLAQLEEIIVTAQKREQLLADVPMSIDVLGQEELDVLSASGKDILFLSGRSPSLYAESSSGRTFPRFYIRGLGNTDFDLNSSQPVSLVYDDVVLENPVLKGFPVFDLDRIEVLRGPQGTVFGRNTPAGVVKFQSVTPDAEPGGYVRASIGRFDTMDIEAAVGGELSPEGFSSRLSGLYQERDDFVDNQFAGGEEGFEEFDEAAWRWQLGYQRDDNFAALLNLHGRHLNNGSRLFRANVIEPGTDQLISGFKRFETAQDATQVLDLENLGGSLKTTISLAQGELTSITAYETIDITARGDVDGGFGADFAPPAGPGSIPFSAETADNINGHDQWTHESRFDTSVSESLDLQVGVFLFYEDLNIENLSFDTLDGGRLNGRAVQDQRTESIGIFSSTEWRPADRWTLTAGLRFTAEDKKFEASRLVGPFGAGALGPLRRDLDDKVWSGDFSAHYRWAENLSTYARYARSFRAPAVQGRIVFGDAVTVADTETIDSLEAGYKWTLLDGRMDFNGSVYYYDTDDQQLTAVGGAGNFNQLLNADSVVGHGIELDLRLNLNQHFTLSAGYSLNDTEIRDSNLQVAPCAVDCQVLNPIDPRTGNALIDGNPLPQAPRHIANLVATVRYPVGQHWLYANADVVYRSDLNFFLYQSTEFSSDDFIETGARVGFQTGDGRHEVSWFWRNLFDERSIQGGIDFNNFSGFVNDPRTWGVELMTRF